MSVGARTVTSGYPYGRRSEAALACSKTKREIRSSKLGTDVACFSTLSFCEATSSGKRVHRRIQSGCKQAMARKTSEGCAQALQSKSAGRAVGRGPGHPKTVQDGWAYRTWLA